MVNEKIIKACKTIIDKHSTSGDTLYELLERETADGLTFYEAELVSQALDNYMAGCKYFFLGSGENKQNDITPYDIVNALKQIDSLDDKEEMYYQVTAVERWGYDMGSDSNAEFFDSLLTDIMCGNAKEAFNHLNDDGNSGFDPYSYSAIASGTANNCGEKIVYNDLTHIMTASSTSMTIYKKCEK